MGLALSVTSHTFRQQITREQQRTMLQSTETMTDATTSTAATAACTGSSGPVSAVIDLNSNKFFSEIYSSPPLFADGNDPIASAAAVSSSSSSASRRTSQSYHHLDDHDTVDDLAHLVHSSDRESIRRIRLLRWQMLLHIVRRAVLLAVLGLFLNNGYDSSHWRIPVGVAALVRHLLRHRAAGVFHADHHTGAHHHTVAFVAAAAIRIPAGVSIPLVASVHFWEWLVIVALLIVSLSITFALPNRIDSTVTGADSNQCAGPAGAIADGGKYAVGGAANYIDLAVFGSNHIANYPVFPPTPSSTSSAFPYYFSPLLPFHHCPCPVRDPAAVTVCHFPCVPVE